MTLKDVELKLVGLLNEAMSEGIPPVVIYTLLHSKAFDCLMMVKQPPASGGQPPPGEGGGGPIIHLPDGRGPVQG